MSKYKLDNIWFAGPEHKDRLLTLLSMDNTSPKDIERLSLFYIVASDKDLYFKFKSRLYDFKEHWIEPEQLSAVNLCTGHLYLVNLGFNLYNNFYDKDLCMTPLDLFSTLDYSNCKVAIEAIKIRIGIY
jgi:hypothetical protein